LSPTKTFAQTFLQSNNLHSRILNSYFRPNSSTDFAVSSICIKLNKNFDDDKTSRSVFVNTVDHLLVNTVDHLLPLVTDYYSLIEEYYV